jgi:hypothetical protein
MIFTPWPGSNRPTVSSSRSPAQAGRSFGSTRTLDRSKTTTSASSPAATSMGMVALDLVSRLQPQRMAEPQRPPLLRDLVRLPRPTQQRTPALPERQRHAVLRARRGTRARERALPPPRQPQRHKPRPATGPLHPAPQPRPLPALQHHRPQHHAAPRRPRRPRRAGQSQRPLRRDPRPAPELRRHPHRPRLRHLRQPGPRLLQQLDPAACSRSEPRNGTAGRKSSRAEPRPPPLSVAPEPKVLLGLRRSANPRNFDHVPNYASAQCSLGRRPRSAAAPLSVRSRPGG